MNIKNILLTGEINVGKSTIINKIIEKYFKCSVVSGFKTLPFYEDESVNKGNIVGLVSEDNNRCYGVSETFEKYRIFKFYKI